MGLDENAQRRIAIVLADILGEPIDVAREVAAFLDGYLRRVAEAVVLLLFSELVSPTWSGRHSVQTKFQPGFLRG